MGKPIGSAGTRLGPPAVARPRSSWTLPAAVLAAVALLLFVLAPEGTGLDYVVFSRAGGRYLRGEVLYRTGEFFAFKYAPIAAAFFAPLALLPERLGWLAVNGLSLVSLVGVLRWAFGRVDPSPPRRPELVWVLAVAAPYYGHLLWLGQTDGLVLGLLAGSEATARRRPLLSGALWALACLVKPPFLTLLLVVFWLRQWRRLAGLAVGVAAWLPLGAARYGVAGGLGQLAAWFRTLGRSTPELLCWQFNQSVFALACTYGGRVGTRRFASALVLLSAAVLAAGLLAVVRLRRADPERGAFALTAFALYLGAFLSPLGWNTNLIAALPMAVALARATTTAHAAWMRRAATAAALAVTVLNALDLVLLPFGIWEDTAGTLLYYRQYAIAGMALAAAGLGCLVMLEISSTGHRPVGH